MRPSRTSRRSLDVSFLVPAHGCPEQLEGNVPRIRRFLSDHFPKSFEIILVPNPVPGDGATLRAAETLARRFPEVRVCRNAGSAGKGLALKEGFALSRGRWIFTTDADLPFDLDFFLQASRLLRLGFHLVTGNRRLPASRFRVPTRVLHMVYQRVLMGLLFNAFVRLLFPIHTSDTQAGIKAMTRGTAVEVFRRQVCPRYSYDIEMFLTAQGTGRRIAELPVVLSLPSEKSTIRIFRSAAVALYWISRIWFLHGRGHYSSLKTA
ncbi:MAG TPA: glycosyltransferase [bacterium]|nr:glycosyltransferase [bacterium]